MRSPRPGETIFREVSPTAPASRGHELWIVALVLLLGVGVPLGMWYGAPADLPRSDARPLVFLTVGSGVRLAFLCATGRPRFLTTLYYVFVYIWLGLAPLLRIGSGTLIADRNTLWRAVGLVLVGTVSFELGLRFSRRPVFSEPDAEGRAALVLSPSRAVSLAVGSLLVTLPLVGFLASEDAQLLFSSWTELIGSIRSVTGSETQAGFQLFLKGMRVPPFAAAYLLYVLFVGRAHERGQRSSWLLGGLLAGNLVLVGLTANPATAHRHWFGTVVLSFFFAEMCRRQAWVTRVGVLWVFAAILVLFPYADLFRDARTVRDIEPSPVDAMASKLDYDAFDQIVAALDLVDDFGHTRGFQILGAATFWVPRTWWPGKPVPSGEMVARAYRKSFTNVSMPLWGEAYLDGGWILTVLYFLLLGWICGWLERGLEVWRLGADLRLAAVLAPVCAGYMLFFLRGALMVAVAYLAPVVALIFLCARRGEAGGGRDRSR